MSPLALGAARLAAVAALILVVPPRLEAQVQTARVTCGSVNAGQQTCRTNATIASAQLERDLNGGRCRQGSTWGFSNSDIWTNSGCHGDFIVTYQNGVVNNGAVVGAGTTQTIRCGDLHGARVQCAAGGHITSARIVKQQIMGTCQPNSTWGYTDNYVWTEKMCIADFEVVYGNQNQNGTYQQNGRYSNGNLPNVTLGTRVIACGAGYDNSSGYGINGGNGKGKGKGNDNDNDNGNRDNGNRGYGNGRGNGNTFTCDAGGRVESVRLVRSEDARRCRVGSTLGFERQQIWVKAGCRGEFEVTYVADRNR